MSKLALAATAFLLVPAAGLAQEIVQQVDEAQPADTDTAAGEEAKAESAEAVPADEEPKEGDNLLDVGTVAPAKDRLVLTLDSGHKIRFKLIGGYRLEFNLISDDYSGNDFGSSYSIGANSYLTDKDQINIRWGMYQRYVADPGEEGLWFNDVRLYYARKFSIPIPEFSVPGKVTLRVTAPTSRSSIGRGYVSAPSLSLGLAPGVGPVTLVTSGYFVYHIARYAEYGNGTRYNTLFTAGYSLGASYSPLKWLGFSASARMSWREKYPTREGHWQDWEPGYGYSLGAGFAIPMPDEAPSLDIGLGFSQGADLLDGGVYKVYFAKREQSTVYLSIGLVY